VIIKWNTVTAHAFDCWWVGGKDMVENFLFHPIIPPQELKVTGWTS